MLCLIIISLKNVKNRVVHVASKSQVINLTVASFSGFWPPDDPFILHSLPKSPLNAFQVAFSRPICRAGKFYLGNFSSKNDATVKGVSITLVSYYKWTNWGSAWWVHGYNGWTSIRLVRFRVFFQDIPIISEIILERTKNDFLSGELFQTDFRRHARIEKSYQFVQ